MANQGNEVTDTVVTTFVSYGVVNTIIVAVVAVYHGDRIIITAVIAFHI
jgi:hypothetical protein